MSFVYCMIVEILANIPTLVQMILSWFTYMGRGNENTARKYFLQCVYYKLESLLTKGTGCNQGPAFQSKKLRWYVGANPV